MEITEAIVGRWVTRKRPDAKWHKAQSIFVGEVLTRCGKFLREKDRHGTELAVNDNPELLRTWKNCTRCQA